MGLSYATFTALLQCKLCGSGLPLLGPMRTVRCSACLGDNPISAENIAAYLFYAPQKMSAILNELTWTHSNHHPCPSCGCAINLAAFPIGSEVSLPCSSCATPISAFPPPPWLREQLPALVSIYGAESDPADGLRVGVAAKVPKQAAPIVTRCPECGGRLAVTSDSARTVVCEHCTASVFLPDDLWRSLHPKQRVAFWTIAWEGPVLRRLEDIRRDEHQAAEQAAAREAQARRNAETQRWLAEKKAAEKAAESARNKKAITVGVILLFGVLLALGLSLHFS